MSVGDQMRRGIRVASRNAPILREPDPGGGAVLVGVLIPLRVAGSQRQRSVNWPAARGEVYASCASKYPMHSSSIEPAASDGRSVARCFLLLFCLCLPVWVIGAIVDIELFPGFQLFQAGLAMPMIASLLLTYRDRRWTGIITTRA